MTPDTMRAAVGASLEAMERVRAALPEFRQQDDYLLAHGASLMSETSHEIIHIDTLARIVLAASPTAAPKEEGKPRNVTASEDRWLRTAVRTGSTLVASGKLASPIAADTQGDAKDAARLDWLARAGDVNISMLVDQPDDGRICVLSDVAKPGVGDTLRAAIDAAMDLSPSLNEGKAK